jgi:hypothetical protein
VRKSRNVLSVVALVVVNEKRAVEGWKAIAQLLRTVTRFNLTEARVRMWAQRHELPVHRAVGFRLVYGDPDAIIEWAEKRNLTRLR